MTIPKLLKQSLRPTVITILVSVILFIIFGSILIYLDRLIDNQNMVRCAYVTSCALRASPAMQVVHTIVYDFETLSRYAGEVGTVFLMTQLVYRVAARHR